MSYHLDLNDQIRLGMVDPDDPADQAAEWAFEVGKEDGWMRGVSEEGYAALGAPETRPAYIEGYAEGFYRRKEDNRWHTPYVGSFEGAGEMFMPRDHDHYGWTDVYGRQS